MKILFDANLVGDWKYVAETFGHTLVRISERNKIIETFDRLKPNFIIVNADIFLKSKEYEYIYKNRKGYLIGVLDDLNGLRVDFNNFDDTVFRIPHVRPYATIESVGVIKREFECDVAIVGNYSKENCEKIKHLVNSNLTVKIFGQGRWPYYQYLGNVGYDNIANIYRSAKQVFPISGTKLELMNIKAAGGFPMTDEVLEDNILEEHTIYCRFLEMIDYVNNYTNNKH